jgi:hypothetical protein
MAVKRLNLADAITTTTETVSRSRTAVVRRGVVSATIDANGVVQIALGGGTVTAVPLVTGVLAVGNQVAVLADTDGYWVVGVIGASTAPATATSWVLESDFGSPAVNFTRQSSNGVLIPQPGGYFLAQFQFQWTNANQITVPSNGAINVTVGSLPVPMRPVWEKRFVTNETIGYALHWVIQADGVVRWCGATPGQTIPATGTRPVALVYMQKP